MPRNTKSKSKVGKSPRGRIKYIAPKPTKPKLWILVAPGIGMLKYRPQLREIKGSAMARKIRNTPACIIAPVYAAVEKFNSWCTAIVENIFEVGAEVHRLTHQQLKLRANSSFPIQCVSPTFYLNNNKVTILVRHCPTSTPMQGGLTTSLQDIHVQTVDQILSENHGLVIQCSGRTFSYWKDKNTCYSLVPEGFGYPDNLMPVLLKSNKLKNILQQTLKHEHGVCSLYSVKVLSKCPVPMTLGNLQAEFEVPDKGDVVTAADFGADIIETVETSAPVETGGAGKVPRRGDKKKTDEEDEPKGPEPISPDLILAYSADYTEFENRGILVGKEYCKDPDRILHTIIAAAIFLHHFPANLWTSTIIRDIMKLGKTIFYQSEYEDLLDNEDWVDRIKFPIKFARKNFQASFDKTVFGRVTTTDSSVLSIEGGLKKFFEFNDTGILAGPQMVLVWQQKNNYFMFDPKERDGLGRKWTRMYSAELGSTALSGSACVTWYRHPKKLAEVYTDNIALKHRKDPYRIVKIRLFETFSKLEDEGEWIGMSAGRWLMVGTKTICDYSYADDKYRVGKAVCIGVAAVKRAMEVPEEDWDSTVIDGVLSEGLELFKLSLPSHDEQKNFTLHSVKRLMDVGDRRVRVAFIDCSPHGPMLGDPKSPGISVLRAGLTEFFDSTRYGLFTVKDIALAIWRGEDNQYYLFYPYEKLFGLPPQCLCAIDNNLPPMGLASAMRFKTITDMFSFLSSNLNTKESDEYCLNPLDLHISDATDRPPLQEYEEFGVGGAILRPFKDLHEGHEMYGVRADKQTLANLLVALGFNRINSSVQWNKEDLADILNIGDKIFCKIFMGLRECEARDYKLQWEDVVPVIGMNKFTFTRDPIVGNLEIVPEEVGEEEFEMNGEEENEEGVEAQDELFVRPQGSAIVTPPATKDLKGILESWDKKKSQFNEAVIETDFFRIAIWKRDDLYFIFDSKASGENGELTERRIEVGKDNAASETFSVAEPQGEEEEGGEREPPPRRESLLEKRNYNEFNNEGTAFVAWFSDFDEFFQHISEKTPADYKYGKFTLHQLVLKSSPVGSDDFEFQLKPGFRAVAPNHSMIRGSIRQSDLSLANRNKQEYSNCIVAIAFAKITPSSKMTTTLLDVILKYGDRLHSKSMNALKKVDKEKFCSIDKLALEELSPIFSIYKIKFNWKVNSSSTSNWINSDLKKSVGKLGTIEAGNAVVLNHKGYLTSFWRSEGGFYLYDPFETNPSGICTENGLPSLSKFGKLENLLAYLLSKYTCFDGLNTFTMYTISIKSEPVGQYHVETADAEEDIDRSRLISYIPKNQEMFQQQKNGVRVLKSPIASNKLPQHCMALAALVHSRLQFVDLWNYNVAQRISFLAKYIIQKTDSELENPLSPPSFDDIRCSFSIDNDILCHIAFTKNIQGPIYSTKREEIVGVNLKNALNMYFRKCQHVVVYMPGSTDAFALWKENGKFYMFCINRVEPEIVVMAASDLSELHDTLLKGVDPEASVNNWYEIRGVVVTTVPIKDGICKPLTVITKEVKDANDGSYVAVDSKEAQYFDHITDKPESGPVKPKPAAFLQLAKGVELLYSKDILKSHRFYGTKDFFLSLQAACVEGSALSRVTSPSLWTKKTLGKLISAGISLYINTVAVKGTSTIQIIDFKGNFFVSDYKLEVCPLPPTVQNGNKDDLLMCLTWILRKYQTAYLYTENFCFTLILENNHCYLYYPGSTEVLCNDLRHDCSCLMRFGSISDLLDRLLTNGEVSLCENVCIGPIYVYQH